MKNFTVILFIFFLVSLIMSIFEPTNLMALFIAIFLAFIIAFICLAYYLGPLLGIITGLLFIATPFLLEYLGYNYGLPFFKTVTLSTTEQTQMYSMLNLNTLFSAFTVPLIFITSLFFGFKIKIFSNIKKYHKTFLIITMSLLLAINFLVITKEQIIWEEAVKWLIIALVINVVFNFLFYFRANISEIFKEIPIILYLALFAGRSLKPINEFNLIVTLVLTIVYLILLYTEYKLRKIKHEVEHLS